MADTKKPETKTEEKAEVKKQEMFNQDEAKQLHKDIFITAITSSNYRSIKDGLNLADEAVEAYKQHLNNQ